VFLPGAASWRPRAAHTQPPGNACGACAQRRRGSRADPVSEDDILRAIAKLGVLGGGFAIVRVGERRMVRWAASEKHAVD